MIRPGVEVKLCKNPDNQTETFILCRSKDRIEKEKAMHERFEKRIEEGLTKIEKACKKGKMKCKILETVKCGQHSPYVYRICVDFVII